MKSFDEVTKALSICGRHRDCKGCPYENVPYPTEIGNTCKDIMHYDALYYMQDRIDKCQEANSPLTWDELKGMEGKPVWIESSDSFNRRRWMFVGEWFDDDEMRLFDMGNDYPDYVSKNGYESGTWQAYRKERG